MDPITAAILISAGTALVTGYMQSKQAEEQAEVARQARVGKRKENRNNRNRLAEEGYNKRRAAMGLGSQSLGAPSLNGNMASQSGGVLTSTTNGNQASGL